MLFVCFSADTNRSKKRISAACDGCRSNWNWAWHWRYCHMSEWSCSEFVEVNIFPHLSLLGHYQRQQLYICRRTCFSRFNVSLSMPVNRVTWQKLPSKKHNLHRAWEQIRDALETEQGSTTCTLFHTESLWLRYTPVGTKDTLVNDRGGNFLKRN